MNTLFIEFRDPLFGIIIFFVLIFIIAFFSYWWGRYKTREDHRYMDHFLRKFQTFPSENELEELLNGENISEKSWLLMADFYYQNGDYEKCIIIYRTLIERESDLSNQREFIFLLGRTYFKAGFLERSEMVLIQLLKQFPRTPQALRYLMLIYEKLHQYDKALDVLGPLSELGESLSLDRLYLECLFIIRNNNMNYDEKAQKLIEIYNKHKVLDHLIFEYLFSHHPALAWKHLELSNVERMIDILWQLNRDVYDLDIIVSNGYLRELFTANGTVDLADGSAVFEFDVMIKLRQFEQSTATLQFEYLCGDCKQVYPFVFHRCPHCNAIDSVVIEPLLTKNMLAEDYYFQ